MAAVVTALQINLHGLAAAAQLQSAPVEWAMPLALAALIFLAVKMVGLWCLRRWAALLWLGGAAIAPMTMTVNWEESWSRYPQLGPFVSWFWFAAAALCILPHWPKMTWRFP